MNVFEADPTAANLAIAQAQADSLNGNALRSLEQFKGTLVHAAWYFARVKGAFPSNATVSSAEAAKRSDGFKFEGHSALARAERLDRTETGGGAPHGRRLRWLERPGPARGP